MWIIRPSVTMLPLSYSHSLCRIARARGILFTSFSASLLSAFQATFPWRRSEVESTSTCEGLPPKIAIISNESPNLTGRPSGLDSVTEPIPLVLEIALFVFSLCCLRDIDTAFVSVVHGFTSLGDHFCLLVLAERAAFVVAYIELPLAYPMHL